MLQDTFTSLADRVEPTVVDIEAVRRLRGLATDGDTTQDDPFTRAVPFERFFQQFPRSGGPTPGPMPGRGPGAEDNRPRARE